MDHQPKGYHQTGRRRAATLVAPLLLICVASLGYLTQDQGLRIALAVTCVVLAVASGAILAGVYAPRVAGTTALTVLNANADLPSAGLQRDLAALDALEPLRAERAEERP